MVNLIERIFTTMNLPEKSLDAAWVRNNVISQNIANIETPGYKRKTVKFEELLADASERKFKGLKTHEKHIEIGNTDSIDIKVMTDKKDLSSRLDGNNVDENSEMASMAKNTIKFYVLIESMNAGFRRLKSAINEGR